MATHANHSVHAKLEKVEDKAQSFLDTLSDKSSQVVSAFNESKDKLIKNTKKHPGMAIAVAGVSGFLLGFILKMLKR